MAFKRSAVRSRLSPPKGTQKGLFSSENKPLLGSGEINHSGSGENRQFWSNENHQSGVARIDKVE